MQQYETQGYGDSSFNWIEAIHILFILIGLLILGWFSVNSTVWQEAVIFFILGIFSLATILTFMALKHEKISLGIPIADKPRVLNRKAVYAIAIILGLVTFFGMFLKGGETQGIYAIQAKTFQLIPLGFGTGLLLDIIALAFENYAFFVAVPSIYFAIGYFLPKLWKGEPSKVLGFILLIALTPTTFVLFHASVYGFSNIAGSMVTAAFGAEMVIMGLLFSDIFYAHARHSANNLGITLARSYGSLAGLFVAVFTNPITWLLVVATLVIIFLRFKRRKKK